MDNHENTVAAEDGMNVEETQEQRAEVSAAELMQDSGAQDKQAEGAQAVCAGRSGQGIHGGHHRPVRHGLDAGGGRRTDC